jgi:hypothetical protein
MDESWTKPSLGLSSRDASFMYVHSIFKITADRRWPSQVVPRFDLLEDKGKMASAPSGLLSAARSFVKGAPQLLAQLFGAQTRSAKQADSTSKRVQFSESVHTRTVSRYIVPNDAPLADGAEAERADEAEDDEMAGESSAGPAAPAHRRLRLDEDAGASVEARPGKRKRVEEEAPGPAADAQDSSTPLQDEGADAVVQEEVVDTPPAPAPDTGAGVGVQWLVPAAARPPPVRPVPTRETPIDVVRIFMWRERRRRARPGGNVAAMVLPTAGPRFSTVPVHASDFSLVVPQSAPLEPAAEVPRAPAIGYAPDAEAALAASRLAVSSAGLAPVQVHIATASVSRLAGAASNAWAASSIGPSSAARRRPPRLADTMASATPMRSELRLQAGPTAEEAATKPRVAAASFSGTGVTAAASDEETTRRILAALGQIGAPDAGKPAPSRLPPPAEAPSRVHVAALPAVPRVSPVASSADRTAKAPRALFAQPSPALAQPLVALPNAKLASRPDQQARVRAASSTRPDFNPDAVTEIFDVPMDLLVQRFAPSHAAVEEMLDDDGEIDAGDLFGFDDAQAKYFKVARVF